MATTMSKMNTDSYARMVIDAIESKTGGRTLTCPVSQDNRWEVQVYQGVLPATDQFDNAQALAEMTLSFPLGVLMCKTCGYSMMFNLFALGLGEDLHLRRV